jgi:hypothetical protein
MQNQISAATVATFVFFAAAIAQWTPDPFCPYPSNEVTRYPYYGNCSVFWECYNGVKYPMECSPGLEFNAAIQDCEDPSLANCDPYASTTSNSNHTTTPGPTTGPEPDCPHSDDLIYFPYYGDCTKYWECFAGNSYLYSCPDGLWWHQEINQCDYPGSYCNNSWTTVTETSSTEWTTVSSTTSGNDPRCSEGGTSYWPDAEDCHKYVECVNGVSNEVTCPPNLYFSDRVKQCVRADESECCETNACDPSREFLM